MTSCQQCGAQTPGTDYCHNCATAFQNNLRALSAGLPELRLIAARKASVMARRHGGSNRSVAPIPLNMNAFQLVQQIDAFSGMLGTALTLRYNRHMPAESLLTAASRRASALLQRRDAASIISIARRYEHKLIMQLTPPEDKRLIGTCPACERDLWCTDTEIASQWIVCKCGQTLKVRDVQEQHLLMCALADNKESRGTAAGIAKLLHANGIEVKRKTINEWRRRGIVTPISMDYEFPVYRVWDIWKALNR